MNTNQSEVSFGNVLIIDDNPDNLRLLSNMLMQQGYKTRRAISGLLALKALESTNFDLILLDITMPDMDGYHVCKQLKNNPQTAQIPVIFISALDDALDKVKAFKTGGIDYITKPFQIEEVTARIDNQIKIISLQKELQEANIKLEQKLIEDNQKLEKTQQALHKSQEKILHSSLRDSLTDLDTRMALMGKLRQFLKLAPEKVNDHFALLIVDCDRLKLYNDILDIQGEQKCLMTIANRLTQNLPSSTIIARLEDNKFGILLREIKNLDSVIELVESLQEKLRLPLLIDRTEISIDPNLGIVFGHNNDRNPEQFLYDAYHALFEAQSKGCGNYQIFDRDIKTKALTELELKSQFRQAIGKQRLLIDYEPVVSLTTGKISGLESILSWYPLGKAALVAEQFIPIAAELNLISYLNNWLIQEVCSQLIKWQEIFIWYDSLEIQFESNFQLEIKLSASQFFQADLVQQIKQITNNLKIDANNILLEIPETALISNPSLAQEILAKLQQLSIQLSIKNFSTNFLALYYQYHFPINNLKIPASLLQEVEKNQAIITAIITIAHDLGMTVTAEGIETDRELDYLRELGCDFGSGSYLSQNIKPTLEMLNNGTKDD